MPRDRKSPAPTKTLTLRLVTGLSTEAEVFELFERDLRPWLDQLPLDVEIVDVGDTEEHERRERLGD